MKKDSIYLNSLSGKLSGVLEKNPANKDKEPQSSESQNVSTQAVRKKPLNQKNHKYNLITETEQESEESEFDATVQQKA